MVAHPIKALISVANDVDFQGDCAGKLWRCEPETDLFRFFQRDVDWGDCGIGVVLRG